jgi:hypothetical protein
MSQSVDHSLSPQMTQSTLLSCTASIVSASGQPKQSHIFIGLTTLDIFLSERGGVRSIMASTLISALQQAMQSGTKVPRSLMELISEASQAPHTISVATTRVPSFGLDLTNPTHAFRILDQLSDLAAGPELPRENVDLDREVLAVHEVYDRQATESFYRSWGPLGVQLETHFILIFLPGPRSGYSSPLALLSAPPSPCVLPSVPPSPRTLLTAPPSRHSPLYQHPSPWNNLTGFGTYSPARTDSPASTHPETSWNNILPQDAVTSPPSHDTSGLTPSCGVNDVFSAFGIDRNRQTSAKFERGSLLEMVQNYNAMYSLLSDIGLRDRGGNMKVTYGGGLELLSSQVLEELGWTVESYKHKSAYQWASVASQMVWKGDPPSECE